MINWLKKIEREEFGKRRFQKTLDFMAESTAPPAKILDLGTPNLLGNYLEGNGYEIHNTVGKDFDFYPEEAGQENFDAVTAFEILEHLINPMGVLMAIKAPKLYASVPLDLWFSSAFKSKTDHPWSSHFHEFEDWQFDWLLEKAGWRVLRRRKWTNPSIVPGLRPALRLFTPRYYMIEAERIS